MSWTALTHRGKGKSPMFPIPTSPSWPRMSSPSLALLLALLQLQDGLSQLAKLAKKERKREVRWRGREGGRMLAGLFGGSRPWDQLCCALWLLHSVALQGCLSWWSCTCGSERDLLLFPSWPHIPLAFPSFSPLFEFSAVQFSLLAKQKKKKKFLFLSLSPTSPGRSSSSFRRRQAREIAQGRVLCSCWKASFGWEWVLRQAPQLFSSL